MHKLEVALLSVKRGIVTDGVPVKTFVKEGSCPPGATRLSGMWMRRMLYTATAPDNTGRLFVSTTKAGLVKVLPDVDAADAQPEIISPPINPDQIPDLIEPSPNAASPESEGAVSTPAGVPGAGAELQVPAWEYGRKTVVMGPEVAGSDDSGDWVTDEDDAMEVDVSY